MLAARFFVFLESSSAYQDEETRLESLRSAFHAIQDEALVKFNMSKWKGSKALPSDQEPALAALAKVAFVASQHFEKNVCKVVCFSETLGVTVHPDDYY